MKKYLYLLAILICSSCDPGCEKLSLINNTNNNQYFRILMDTALNRDFTLDSVFANDSVKPEIFIGSYQRSAWIEYINSSSCDSTLHIFVFKTDKLTDNIIKSHNYKRLDFKVKDLDKLKWRVEINEEDMKW